MLISFSSGSGNDLSIILSGPARANESVGTEAGEETGSEGRVVDPLGVTEPRLCYIPEVRGFLGALGLLFAGASW